MGKINICVNCINFGVICIFMCVFVYFGEDRDKLVMLEDLMLIYLYLMSDDFKEVNG